MPLGAPPQQPVVDALRLVGLLPQDVAQQQAVVLCHLRAAAGVGGHLHEGHRFDEAAV